jgi:hypothetical protein
MISTRSVGLLIDTVVCLTLAKWETVSGRFGGYLKRHRYKASRSRVCSASFRCGGCETPLKPLVIVIAGLDPAIHPPSKFFGKKMDARVKPGHDAAEFVP